MLRFVYDAVLEAVGLLTWSLYWAGARLAENELERQAQTIAARYGLHALVLAGVRSVGVMGDSRTYFPTVMLRSTPNGALDWEQREAIARQLTSECDTNRVLWSLELES